MTTVMQGITMIYFVFLLCILFNRSDSDVVEEQFFAGSSPVCDDNNDTGSDAVSSGCFERLSAIQNLAQCLQTCSNDESCIGVTVDQTKTDDCLVHYICPSQGSSCKVTDLDKRLRYRHYSKNCAHGGKWIPTEGRCRCVYGWVGGECQDLPRFCSDLIHAGYETGNYQTNLDLGSVGLGQYPVSCNVNTKTKFTAISIMGSNVGGMDYNRSWSDYRKGFMESDSIRWIGLDTWSALSQGGYSRFIVSIFFEDIGHVYAIYHDFVMTDASDGFRFHFRKSNNNLRIGSIPKDVYFGDCFGPYQGIRFSTFNKDRDGNEAKNCAAARGSGWWFKNGCGSKCNLFGWNPSYRKSKPRAQWMSVSGVPDTYMTTQLFQRLSMYVTQVK